MIVDIPVIKKEPIQIAIYTDGRRNFEVEEAFRKSLIDAGIVMAHSSEGTKCTTS